MKKISRKTLAKMLVLGLLVGGTGWTATQPVSAEEVEDFHPPQMTARPDFQGKVSRSVEKIDNGVVITLTSTDAGTVQKIQEWEATAQPHGRLQDMENVTRTLVQLDNGVQITLTSDDAETVQKLQEGPRGGGHHRRLQNVERSVEKIENGVIITLTSDDPDVVKKLQDHEAKKQ